jgi:hypothetical protein
MADCRLVISVDHYLNKDALTKQLASDMKTSDSALQLQQQYEMAALLSMRGVSNLGDFRVLRLNTFKPKT